MGTLSSIFHVATEALRQDQLALTATTDNISNQNTAGYARRSVTWTARDTVSLSGAVNAQAGAVTVTAQRDTTLDRAVATTTASSSAASAMQTALNTLQNVFAINSSGEESSGIGAALSGFFSSMQQIAADPSSSSARQAALSAARTVVSTFNQASAQISQQVAQLNGTVSDGVSALNAKTAQIAALNQSITLSTNTADRDQFVDQRTALIEDVSKLVGVQQTANSNGSVSLFTTSGAPLVVGTASQTLSAAAVNGEMHIFAHGADVTADLTGGSIGGGIAARDGAVAGTQSNLDALASSFAGAVNAANAAGKTTSGAVGGAIFAMPTAGSAAAGMAVAAATGGDFAAAGQSEGNGGSRNANAMALLQTQAQANGMTFADTLSAIVSGVGTAASAAQTSAATTGSALTQATAARDAISGVSLDTEAANLTQYQRSYQAEAKLLAVLDSVLQAAINIGTQTAV